MKLVMKFEIKGDASEVSVNSDDSLLADTIAALATMAIQANGGHHVYLQATPVVEGFHNPDDPLKDIPPTYFKVEE